MDTKGVGTVGILLVLGLFLGGFGFLPTYDHNIAVQEGKPTTAVVQSTDIEVTEDDDGDKSYNPIVVYEYEVNGETYVSDNTFPGRFDRTKGSRSWAEGIVSQYQPGDVVTVHYRPYKPWNAYLRNDGRPGTRYVGLAYAVIAVVAGGWLIRTGFRRRKQRELMEDTPTENVRSMSVGRTEIKGTARTEDRDPMSAPFSGEACVVAEFEIEQYDDDDDDSGGSWDTIESGTLHVPFYLDDGTGSVLVDPHDDATFDLDPDEWSETYVDSSSRGPRPIREFVQSRDDVDFPGHVGGKENDRKYRQNVIRVGESVYVFGQARPRDEAEREAGQEDLLVVDQGAGDTLAAGDMYMISDDTEAGLTDRREWALWRAPVGVFFLTVALVFVIGMYGPDVGLRLPVLF